MIRILNHLSILAGIIISLLWSAASLAATRCTLPTTRTHTVIGITDARTLKLDNGEQLRLAAILAPTAYDSPAAPAIWPPETAARQALLARVLGRNIAVALERRGRDRYGRTIGQVLLEGTDGNADEQIDHRWLQAMTIHAGHARVTLPPQIDAACAQLLLAVEAQAEAGRRGLWRLAAYKPRRAEDTVQLIRYRSTYQIVEGVVARVSVRRSAIYLNFGRDWKRDFTAKLSRTMLRRAGIDHATVQRLGKRPVRIRGWIEKRNGPLTTIWRTEQIELLVLTPTGQTVRHDPPRLLSQAISDDQ
ncbi:MAG: thermonuclease family protein [Hyphomicrobiaceae bacterium]